MPTALKNLTVDDLIDFAIIGTACLGFLVILIIVALFALLNPAQASSFVGDFSPQKGAGIGGILLFLFLIIRLVIKRRKNNGKQ